MYLNQKRKYFGDSYQLVELLVMTGNDSKIILENYREYKSHDLNTSGFSDSIFIIGRNILFSLW